MSQDILTIQKLVDTMQVNNAALRERIDNIASEERVLDGPPVKYSPLRVPTDNLEPFGMYQDYRREYAMQYGQQEPKEGTIVIGKETVTCPYRVLIVLKALFACGITKSNERAVACREIFGKIISRRFKGELTEELMQPVLKNTGDYYKNEIIRAIVDSLYSPMEQVTLALKSALGDNYYDKVIELFPEVNDMDSFEDTVAKIYKRACCTASFKVEKKLGKIVNTVRYLEKLHSSE